MDIKVKLINGGTMPQKQHEGDACFDCYANEAKIIPNGKVAKIPLGFALQLPENFEAQIRPRSGLSSKGILTQLGTVDSNFRGEVCAIVYNASGADFHVGIGDRICQLAIRMVALNKEMLCNIHWYIYDRQDEYPSDYSENFLISQNLIEVKELEENSDRGDKGFGSSGV